MMSCLLWKSVIVLSVVWAVRGQSSGDLRLVGPFSQTRGSSGRLEFYYNEQWGTACRDMFSRIDARVACRQLGFSAYTRYGTVGALGFSQLSNSSITPIWLDELRCRGTESRLIDCPADPIRVEDCNHSEDVALDCFETPTSSTPSADVWIYIGVAMFLIFIFISVIVISILLRRRLHRVPPRNPLDHTTSTHSTTYSMNQRSSNSNQSPSQNVHGPQPTGQYASSPYRTSYPQQPPAMSYLQQPPAAYSQQPPAHYSIEEPPSVPYPTEKPLPAQHPIEKPPAALYFSGGEAPPPYPG